MPTEAQREKVRFDTGYDTGDGGGLPDATIDTLYEDATTLWVGNTAAIEAQVRLDVIDNLLMQASKRVNYRQNQSSENAGDIFEHLYKMRAKFQKAIDDETTTASAAVAFGGLRRSTPKTIVVPDDYTFPATGNEDISRIGGETGS